LGRRRSDESRADYYNRHAELARFAGRARRQIPTGCGLDGLLTFKSRFASSGGPFPRPACRLSVRAVPSRRVAWRALTAAARGSKVSLGTALPAHATSNRIQVAKAAGPFLEPRKLLADRLSSVEHVLYVKCNVDVLMELDKLGLTV
jgi:hypothetical protein